MNTIRKGTVLAIIAAGFLWVLGGTAEAVMVSGWEPVGDNVVTLTFSDDAGNIIVGSIRKAIFWELGTEENPKFVQWDETATFVLRMKDGTERPLPNAVVKKRIKMVYRSFSPAGRLKGNLAELNTAQAEDRACIAAAQDSLRALGYDPGPSDGLAGAMTQAALRAFQRRKSLSETGRLDEATAEALGVILSPPRGQPHDDPCVPALVIQGNSELYSPDLSIAGNGNWREDPFRFSGATITIEGDTMIVN